MVSVDNFSISKHNEPIFTALKKLGGNKSEHIAKAVKDYLYRKGTVDNNISPEFHENMELWKRYLQSMSEEDALLFNKKFEQIERVFRGVVEKFVR